MSLLKKFGLINVLVKLILIVKALAGTLVMVISGAHHRVLAHVPISVLLRYATECTLYYTLGTVYNTEYCNYVYTIADEEATMKILMTRARKQAC